MMKFKVSYCIEHGRNKQASEDSALIGKTVVNDECGTLEITSPAWICLCDGVGGNAGGREASLFVTKELSSIIPPNSVEEIRNIFVGINNRLLERASNSSDHKTMATTATAICFSDDTVFLAHIGNTRLYSKRGPYIQQMTIDQTTYQWLIDQCDFEAAEACNKNEIRGAMGGGKQEYLNPFVAKRLFERKIASTILLTSDGVHEYLSQDKIEDIINSESEMIGKVTMLCKQALNDGSDDDRSAIIIEIG